MSSEEKGMFEEQWQDAFEDAEMQPPAHLWSGIDSALANEEAGKLNKQVQIYRYVAAAAVFLCFSLVIYLMTSESITEPVNKLAGDPVTATPTESVAELNDSENSNAQIEVTEGNESDRLNKSSNKSELSAQFSNTLSESVAELDDSDHPNTQAATIENGAKDITKSDNHTATLQVPNVFESVAELDGSERLKAESIDVLQNGSKVNQHVSNSDNSIVSNNSDIEDKTNDLTGVDTSVAEMTSNHVVAENREVLNISLVESSERTVLAVNEISRKNNDTPLIEGSRDIVVDGVPIYLSQFKDKKRYLQDSWASVEFGGGLFEPNYSSNTAALEFNSTAFTADRSSNLLESGARYESANVQNNEDMTAGSSYVMGMSYGTRISRRIIVQSGLQYGIYESSSVTNTVFETSATTGYALSEQSLNDPALSRIVQEGDYQIRYENVELRNTFRMASVPVKAGYVVMDQKLNIMLDGGIQANLFLGNELSDPDNNLETVEIRPGESSPYRTINFSAITGVTLGYSFLDNYALTVKPSYQRSINSLTKETSNFSATPEGFGLSIGVRYVFQ